MRTELARVLSTKDDEAVDRVLRARFFRDAPKPSVSEVRDLAAYRAARAGRAEPT